MLSCSRLQEISNIKLLISSDLDLDSTVFTLTIWIIPTTHIHFLLTASLLRRWRNKSEMCQRIQNASSLLKTDKVIYISLPLKINQNKIKNTWEVSSNIRHHNKIQNILSFLNKLVIWLLELFRKFLIWTTECICYYMYFKVIAKLSYLPRYICFCTWKRLFNF